MTARLTQSDPAAQVIVFSDLDGTLLDHHSYDHAPAAPTLDRLRRLGIPLILASSKTQAEMAPLRQALGFAHCPMICENGAGLVGVDQHEDAVTDYAGLRAALDAIPAPLRQCFEGFGDMDTARISAVTGLSVDQARLAAQRAFSEPGLWTGSDAARDAFLSELASRGVSARSGGRFLTLSFGSNKADHIRTLTARFNRPLSIAMGDAPNDAEMLGAAEYAIVIPNPHGPSVQLPATSMADVLTAEQPGPAGWNATLGALLNALGVAE